MTTTPERPLATLCDDCDTYGYCLRKDAERPCDRRRPAPSRGLRVWLLDGAWALALVVVIALLVALA